MDSNHICLEVINLKSALKKDQNYYMQVLLKECKYIGKKLIRNINGNLSDFSFCDFSLVKHKLEWLSLFVSQLPFNLITPGGPAVYLKLTKFDQMTWQWIRVFFLIVVKRKICFIHQDRISYSGKTWQTDCKSGFYPLLIQPRFFLKLIKHRRVRIFF